MPCFRFLRLVLSPPYCSLPCRLFLFSDLFATVSGCLLRLPLRLVEITFVYVPFAFPAPLLSRPWRSPKFPACFQLPHPLLPLTRFCLVERLDRFLVRFPLLVEARRFLSLAPLLATHVRRGRLVGVVIAFSLFCVRLRLYSPFHVKAGTVSVNILLERVIDVVLWTAVLFTRSQRFVLKLFHSIVAPVPISGIAYP